MMRYLLYFFLILSAIAARGQKTIIVSDAESMQRIGGQVYFLEDTTGELSLKDILTSNHQKQFQRHTKEVFKAKVTGASYWFKLKVRNETKDDIWLEIGDGYSNWYIDFYAPDENGGFKEAVELGTYRPQENKQLPSDYYCVKLAESENQQERTYYFRVKSLFPQTNLYQIGTTKAIVKHHNLTDYVVAAFVSLMLSMILYNLFLFISIKNKLYLFYILYLIFLLPEVPFNLGYSIFDNLWLWENAYL